MCAGIVSGLVLNIRLSRRRLVESGLAALLTAPWAVSLRAATAATVLPGTGGGADGAESDDIVLGVSAAFSGPSRGLGTELYRGAAACFAHVNASGGINGRRIALKMYDDGYQPDPCVENTMLLRSGDSRTGG